MNLFTNKTAKHATKCASLFLVISILCIITSCVTPSQQPSSPETPVTPSTPSITTQPVQTQPEDYTQSLLRSVQKTIQKISFGAGSAFSDGWTVEVPESRYKTEITPQLTTVASIDDSSYGVCFNFRKLGTETASLGLSATVAENTSIYFSLKTDIYGEYDGYLVFYVDGKEQLRASGVGSNWNEYAVSLEKGSHNLEWKAEGTSNSYTLNCSNSVCMDNVYFIASTPVTTMLETFDSGDLSAFMWTTDGVKVDITWDEFVMDWIDNGSAGLLYADDHGYVAKLSIIDRATNKRGSSFIVLPKVSPQKKSALSFDYKMQLAPLDSLYVAVFIDGKEALRIKPQSYSETPWRNVSVPVSAGNHSIKIGVVSEEGISITGNSKNCLLIDNVSLVPDETAYTTIYPSGLQETYETGFPLQFTASARRADGSVKENSYVTWNVNNNGVITADGVFTPTKAGVFTISATIDGKTAYNEKVVVHPKDYINRTYTYNGVTYGELTNLTGTRHDTGTVTFDEYTPDGSSFSAKGFFVLSGKVNNPSAQNYAYVRVSKDDNPSLSTYYMLKDNFNQRIWLRFGKGNYTITISDLTSIQLTNASGARANVMGFESTTRNAMTFNVTNTDDTKGELVSDARWIFPSYQCPSDDFRITNLANALLGEIGYDAPVSEKLRAAHNWLVENFTYDTVSRDDKSRRLSQDALNVLSVKKGVCEGYTNLFIALERYMGIEGRTIPSAQMNHAWNNTVFNGKWYLVDVTWDDPTGDYEGTEREMYTYFLTTLTGKDNDHPAEAIDSGYDTEGPMF